MSREIESVAISIYAQLIHDNISYSQADKLVSTIMLGWDVRNVPFDRKAFERLALRGEK
jgi:hypothetical protein